MIDPHELAAKLCGTLRPSDANARTARLALAAVWDDAVAHLPPKMRDADAPNPYRRDNDDVAQPADRYETWHDVDVDPVADAAVDGPHPPDGVWIVWRSHGDRSNGFNAIYPADEEIQALRQVNADGFGSAEFIEYGPYRDLP